MEMAEAMYVDQSAANLQLALVHGELDTSQFNVLCRKTLGVGTLSIDAGVIGASHFVTCRWQGEPVINEVFSCLEAIEGQAEFHPLVNSRRRVWQRQGRAVYAFNAETLYSAAATGPLHKLERMVLAAREEDRTIGLRYAFPRDEGMTEDPMTLVYCATMGEETVVILTAHSYPQESAVVFSRTMIKKGKGGSKHD